MKLSEAMAAALIIVADAGDDGIGCYTFVDRRWPNRSRRGSSGRAMGYRRVAGRILWRLVELKLAFRIDFNGDRFVATHEGRTLVEGLRVAEVKT